MKPRFTIRDLLWLVVVIALALGWWVDRRVLLDYPKPVFHYLNATAARFALTPLKALLVGTDATVMVDERNNAILATARPSQQVVIREWIEQFDQQQQIKSGIPDPPPSKEQLLKILGDAGSGETGG